METFDLLPVLAAGDLTQTSAPELVAAIYRSRASGTLSLEGEGREEIRLFFKSGDSCGATRPAGFRSLAQILLATGTLTPEQVERASAAASTSGRKLGEALVSAGFLTLDQVHAALATQHRENLRLLMQRNVGRYEWRGWEPPPGWAAEVTVDPTRPVLEALALPQLTGRRQAVLRWLSEAPAVRASLDFGELAARAELLLQDRRAAELFERPITTEKYFAASGLPLPRAEALLVTLLLLGGVEPVQPASAQPLDPSAFEPSPPPLPVEAALEPEALQQLPESAVSAPEVPQGPPPLPPDLGDELAAELATELGPRAVHPQQQDLPPQPDTSELFGAPGSIAAEAELEPIAAAPELVAPAQESSVELGIGLPEDQMELTGSRDEPVSAGDPFEARPARRSGAHSFDNGAADALPALEVDAAEPPPVDPDLESRARRKRMVGAGLRNLGMRGPAGSEPIEGGVVETKAQKPRPEPGALPLSEDDQSFLAEVRARARAAPRLDAYSRLGVQHNASQDQIRSAYLSLVKRFHPDRAQAPQLMEALPELEALFGALREAYEHIGSAEAREAYDQGGRTFGGAKRSQSRAEEALLTLKKGEVLLKKRDYEAALRELRRSVDLDPTPEALTALAWGLINDRSQGPSAREEALKLTARALKLDHQTARAHYVAGVLKRTSEPDGALDHFRAAVALDPRNNDAALELRLLERRQGKKPTTGPLSRLFKRDGK